MAVVDGMYLPLVLEVHPGAVVEREDGVVRVATVEVGEYGDDALLLLHHDLDVLAVGGAGKEERELCLAPRPLLLSRSPLFDLVGFPSGLAPKQLLLPPPHQQ